MSLTFGYFIIFTLICYHVLLQIQNINVLLLQILSLDWSSGIKSLKCVGRVDLTLIGSFADIVLLPYVGERKRGTSLYVLANPGQLHAYDNAYLSGLMSQQEKVSSSSGVQYPMVIPNIEPRVMVAKLGFVHKEGKVFGALDEVLFLLYDYST